MSSKQIIKKLLAQVDIKINGDRPWDIQVHNEKFYGRALRYGSLGFGESYMDGWWDVVELDEFFNKILRSRLDSKIKIDPMAMWRYIHARMVNMSKLMPFQVGKTHYDIGNDLYEAMLDKRLTYTCGYWKNAETLDEAQNAKLDLTCKKIGIKKGDKVLDIGSGWGSFINFAAEKYGAECVGLTISKEQADYANTHHNGLQVETRLQDYRDVDGQFDHIVSLGMFEHVGYRNYRVFMEKVHSLLKDDGLFLLHTIAGNTSVTLIDPWFSKYIFPNSLVPSASQITKAAEGLFVMEDWHSFGQYYDTTLMHWFKNFDSNWDKLKDKYDDRFYRMWKYYLLSSAGSFRARRNQLWQIVFSKSGVVGGYSSMR